jgi:hypothetical protein
LGGVGLSSRGRSQIRKMRPERTARAMVARRRWYIAGRKFPASRTAGRGSNAKVLYVFGEKKKVGARRGLSSERFVLDWVGSLFGSSGVLCVTVLRRYGTEAIGNVERRKGIRSADPSLVIRNVLLEQRDWPIPQTAGRRVVGLRTSPLEW